ncbi:MAG: hypothetical protein IIB00_07960, partial [candidate division Zixibacteria bacterium]|nr:hypothetical protein [candidate division Zixibacteria bacterium]
SDNITIVCIKALDVNQQTIYQPTPAQTIAEENVATGEREDEWLDILAEQNRLEAEEFEEEDAARKSRGFATLAFVILLMFGAVIYYFYEGGL